MKNIKINGFTLVELLVVIAIIAILSVVGYQSFGGATSKAQNAAKKSNITNLATTLNVFETGEKYYPMPQAYSATNLWGYNSGTTAQISNTMKVVYDDQEVSELVTADTKGGGIIYSTGTGTWAGTKQIGAKGVIGINGSFNKKYLKDDIYDTQLGDIKLTLNDEKMIDYGIGKFTYAVYARASDTSNWNNSGNRGLYFELAATYEDIDSEGYVTNIVGNYSKDNFDQDVDNYPENLIGLKDGEVDKNVETTVVNQGIPYPINNFASN